MQGPNNQWEQRKFPSDFTTEGKRWAQSIHDVLDEIYAKYGRLNEKDLSKAFVKRISDAEGGLSEVEQTAQNILLSVSNTRVYRAIDQADLMTQLEAENVELHAGLLWQDTTLNLLMYYNGTSWVVTETTVLRTSFINILEDLIEVKSGGGVVIDAGADFDLNAGSGGTKISISNHDDDGYFLSAGSEDKSKAPFSVKMDGTIQNVSNTYVQTVAENADEFHGVELDVYFPSDVSLVDKCLLSVKFAPFRAYEVGAANNVAETSGSGGAQTSSSGGSQTSESGGASTSSGGGAPSSEAGGQQTSGDGGAQTSEAGGAQTSSSGGAQTSSSGGGAEKTSRGGGGISETLSISSKLSGKSGAGVEVSYSGDTDSYLGSTNDDGTGYTDNPNKDYTGDKAPGATDGPDTDATSALPSSYDDGSGWASESVKNTGTHAEHRHGIDPANTGTGQKTYYADSHNHTLPSGADSHYHTIGHKHTLSSHTHDISGTHWHSLSTHQHKGPNHSHVMNHKHSMSHVHTLSDHQHYIDHSHTLNVSSHTHIIDIDEHTHTIEDHTHTIENHTHAIASHTHEIANHVHAIAEHTHLIYDHTHLIKDHTHDVVDHTHLINAHTHPITYGIYEGTTPTNCTLLIDGTAVAGKVAVAPFLNFDVAPYFDKLGTQIARDEFHTIEIRPNTLGRISAHLYVKTTQVSKVAGSL